MSACMHEAAQMIALMARPRGGRDEEESCGDDGEEEGEVKREWTGKGRRGSAGEGDGDGESGGQGAVHGRRDGEVGVRTVRGGGGGGGREGGSGVWDVDGRKAEESQGAGGVEVQGLGLGGGTGAV